MWLDNSAQLWTTGENVGSQVKNKKGKRMSFFYRLSRESTDCYDSVGFILLCTSHLRERQDFGCCGRQTDSLMPKHDRVDVSKILLVVRLFGCLVFIYLGPLQRWGQRPRGIQSEMCECCFVAQYKRTWGLRVRYQHDASRSSAIFPFKTMITTSHSGWRQTEKLRPQTVQHLIWPGTMKTIYPNLIQSHPSGTASNN